MTNIKRCWSSIPVQAVAWSPIPGNVGFWNLEVRGPHQLLIKRSAATLRNIWRNTVANQCVGAEGCRRHPEDGHVEKDDVKSELMAIGRSESILSKYNLLHPSCECVQKNSIGRQEDNTDRDMMTMDSRTVTGSPDYHVRKKILEHGDVRDTPRKSKTFELRWLKGGETPGSNLQMVLDNSLVPVKKHVCLYRMSNLCDCFFQVSKK